MSQCKTKVSNGSWAGGHRQCARNAVKDGFCKQHHPEEVRKRRDESAKKYEESIRYNASKISGADRFKKALENCISAAGNPDPAQGCRLVIEICKEALEE